MSNSDEGYKQFLQSLSKDWTKANDEFFDKAFSSFLPKEEPKFVENKIKDFLEIKDNYYNDGSVKCLWEENKSWSWLSTDYQTRSFASPYSGSSEYLCGGFDTFVGNQKYRRGES